MIIDKVILTLENCEEVEIDNDYIENIFVGGITRNIYTDREYLSADCFYLQVIPNANHVVYSFGIESFPEDLFTRLSYGDICEVDIYYKDKPKESFTLPYDEESDMLGSPNTYQRTKYDEFGNLCILVSEDDEFNDFGV